MTGRQRMVIGLLASLAAVPMFQATARGQAAHVDPYQNGAAPAFPGRATAAAAAQQAAAANAAAATGYANPLYVDPMAPMLMYGGLGMPMTRGQAGLTAISSIQQMTGLGSGQISGVRGGSQAAPQAAAHTRNMNISGGQASSYFNRAEPRRTRAAAPVAATSGREDSRRFYQRPSRNFPERTR